MYYLHFNYLKYLLKKKDLVMVKELPTKFNTNLQSPVFTSVTAIDKSNAAQPTSNTNKQIPTINVTAIPLSHFPKNTTSHGCVASWYISYEYDWLISCYLPSEVVFIMLKVLYTHQGDNCCFSLTVSPHYWLAVKVLLG